MITTKSGEDIQATVVEITTSEVKYKRFDNLDGPLFTEEKSNIVMIRYENGTKDIFTQTATNEENAFSNLSSQELYILGQRDAAKHYDRYKAAATGTLITGLISPLVGLIPAITCSSTSPSQSNLNSPNPDLMKKSDYYDGYRRKAKKIKQSKVWANWGISFAVNIFAVLLLATL